MQHSLFFFNLLKLQFCVFIIDSISRHCEGLPNVWCTVDQESVESFCPR